MKILLPCGFALFLSPEEAIFIDIDEDVITITDPSGLKRVIRIHKSHMTKIDPIEDLKNIFKVQYTSSSGQSSNSSKMDRIQLTSIPEMDSEKEKASSSTCSQHDSKTASIEQPSGSENNAAREEIPESMLLAQEQDVDIAEELRRLEIEILNLEQKFINNEEYKSRPRAFAKEFNLLKERCHKDGRIIQRMSHEMRRSFDQMDLELQFIERKDTSKSCKGKESSYNYGNKSKRSNKR